MNKYQEALNFLETINNDIVFEQDYGEYSACCDFLYELQELIDNHEKYHWHDLKENPYDLPKQCKPVLCISREDGYLLLSRRDDWWEYWDTGEFYLPTKAVAYVYAWKYIEEFEDD